MKENQAYKLSVIIVNYYSEKLVENCISSLLKNSEENLEIILVDNGSETNLLQQFRSHDVKIIKNERNMGFGFACNLGAKNCSSDNILFLNPDTTVFKNTISNALDFFNSNSEITVLGCQQVNENGQVLKTCTKFLTPKKYLVKSFYLDKTFPNVFKSHLMTYWDHLDSRYVDHVMGSFYMIRKDKFNELNGFDEDYFVYYEDLDLSKRVKDIGGKIYYNADIQIYHKLGGTSERVKAERLSYSLDSVLKYSKKHFYSYQFFLMFIHIFFVEFLLRIGFSILKLNANNFREVIKGYGLLAKKSFLNFKK